MKTSTANNSIYATIETKVSGNTWDVMKVSGAINYVMVTKKTNNPFGGRIGKQFANFELAAKHYKSPEMKTALMMCEIEFDASEKQRIEELAKLN